MSSLLQAPARAPAASHPAEGPPGIDWGHGDLLVSLADFKWLMAARGLRVDVERLGHDMAYADQCLKLGMGSGCDALRARSTSLLSHLARALARSALTSRMARGGPAPLGTPGG